MPFLTLFLIMSRRKLFWFGCFWWEVAHICFIGKLYLTVYDVANQAPVWCWADKTIAKDMHCGASLRYHHEVRQPLQVVQKPAWPYLALRDDKYVQILLSYFVNRRKLAEYFFPVWILVKFTGAFYWKLRKLLKFEILKSLMFLSLFDNF